MSATGCDAVGRLERLWRGWRPEARGGGMGTACLAHDDGRMAERLAAFVARAPSPLTMLGGML